MEKGDTGLLMTICIQELVHVTAACSELSMQNKRHVWLAQT